MLQMFRNIKYIPLRKREDQENKKRGEDMEPKKPMSIQLADAMEHSRKQIFKDDLIHQFMQYTGAEAGIKMADLGCGTGAFTRYLRKGIGAEADITGIDINPEYIEFAMKQADLEQLQEGIRFKVGDIYQLPFEAESLDAITDHTTLINLEDPKKAIMEELRVLKKGGVISTATFLVDVNLPERIFEKRKFSRLYKIQQKLTMLLKQSIFHNGAAIGANDTNIFRIAQLYKECGVKEVQINGICAVFSPDDFRYQAKRQEWLENRYCFQEWEIRSFMKKAKRLKKAGLRHHDLVGALKLLKAQYLYEQKNTTWIFNNTVEIIISGRK